MGYGKRDLLRIQIGICVDCKIELAAKPSPRCRPCCRWAARRERSRYIANRQTNSAKLKARLRSGAISYVEVKRRRDEQQLTDA